MAAEQLTRPPAFVDGKTQNAQDMRLQVLSSAGGATPLASRGGVRPSGGNPGLVAALPTPAMKVRVNAGIADVPSTSPSGGFYRVAWDQVDLDIDPSSAQARTDLVIVEVVDTGTSAATGKVRILKGTSGGGRPTNQVVNAHWLTVAAAAVRVGAESSGNIRSQDVTPETYYAVAPGGVLPVKNKATRLALQDSGAVYDGLVVDEQDTDRLWLYTGSTWRYLGGGPPPTFGPVVQSGWSAGSRAPFAFVDGSGTGSLGGQVVSANAFAPNGAQSILALPGGVPSPQALRVYAVPLLNSVGPTWTTGYVSVRPDGQVWSEGVASGSVGAGSSWYLDGINWHPTQPAAGVAQ